MESNSTTAEVEVIDLTGIESSDSGSDSESDGEGHDHSGSEAGSEDSEVEIQLNEETRAQLHNAISSVSESRLRHVLKNLIGTDQAVEIALTRELITLKRETQTVVPRWERCMNCELEYDINTRRDEHECSFHTGELEVDEDGFADWDEKTHGPMDTPENRAQYPEEFEWTCCNENGTSRGCVRGEHKPSQASKKRKRSD
ncbi:hypothetical protein FA15DRAFT_679361 [Coprinopsis marcescibilis]|uniref:C2H2-type domain-containing protein n=1 Tax=Coprinopsis marcescibilis TaxID=230819 RepID=A0A5C3L1B8_COPMA|nr:hypothetical protein FA15DRAFT_679361 [Coprinopsis marcescibilis]